ncbi:MAG: non-canonical purine NTP pyrophosphatase, partial [Solirubrobacterales bacterium]
DDNRTFAEISAEEKNEISHRGRATRMLARHLGLAEGVR